MILFIIGALIGGVVGYTCGALMAIIDRDGEENE